MELADFDAEALFEAMDAKRTSMGLSWAQVAQEVWRQSSVLNELRPRDHPISPSTMVGMKKRGNTSCQHALFFLRWLGRSPESFLPGAAGARGTALPPVGPDRRLRWDLNLLYEAANSRRNELGMTWSEAARELGCTPSQLTGLRTARFATGMRLAMRIVQWVGRPSSDFIYAARW